MRTIHRDAFDLIENAQSLIEATSAHVNDFFGESSSELHREWATQIACALDGINVVLDVAIDKHNELVTENNGAEVALARLVEQGIVTQEQVALLRSTCDGAPQVGGQLIDLYDALKRSIAEKNVEVES